jgi:SNF2 family DNA or RNA helicase
MSQLEIKNRKSLRRIQNWGAEKIYDQDIVILAWDMGAGKTVTVLTALRDLLDDYKINKVLIVAPLLVAKATWPDEIEEWRHTRVLDYTLIRSEDDDEDNIRCFEAVKSFVRFTGFPATAAGVIAKQTLTQHRDKKRRAMANDDSEIHILNKEALAWLWEHFKEGKTWPYDMIVIDEASMLKNAKRRTKTKGITRFGVLAKARKYAKRAVLMTGTPAPKGLQNLWGLAYIADLGDRLGSSKHHFEQRWFEKDYMGYNLTPRPHAHDEIMGRLKDIMFSLAPEDYAELPGVVTNKIEVELPPRVMGEYRKFERTLVSQIYDVEAVSRGVLTNKLLQFSNGSMYQEDGKDVWIHDEKLAALEAISDEAMGDPMLIAYSFKFDLARILKRFPKAEIFGRGDVRRMKQRWNDGYITHMIAHPDSIGHGQNVQFGGNISVWYGLTHDLELYLQFNKRLDRPGQTRVVFNHHIIAKDTHDEDILPLLSGRKVTQDAVLESTVVRLGRIRN